ncbi:Transglutaminase-like superfamily protein [Evansella caseinilytica]|uniref:Transglutaminase-like superfamily protein n=1 Tax=Evansella caseinilytica TaxID=1503961 RepID=A0A1H3SE47_9BACI|nr:transglutaminase family protein [Evansella caseinilytica]SDZ36007.1 Transglutaminase-like superfamily protein [Evansella caseinilytica]
MKLILESEKLENYLHESRVVNYSHESIQETADRLFPTSLSEVEKAVIAFEFVRDEIYHSWDIQGKVVTCKASDVLAYKQGICYAKANALAALLRLQGIPTGFCYQRLMLFDVPEKGYCIHALNAVFLRTTNRWVRLDARGNKLGVDARFSLKEERLAFSPQTEMGEIDYPLVYTAPHPQTITVLQENTDALEMYQRGLPERLP